MNDGGFVKLYRKMVSWGWYTDGNTFRVFLHLLLTASYEDNEFRGHKIRAGQVVTGRKRLAADLGMSERAVRTALNHLKSTNEITIKSTNKFSIITIENWGKYQLNDVDVNQQINQQADHQLTSKTAKSNHTIRNKESKNIYGGRTPRKKKNSLDDTYAMIEDWAKDE